MPESWLLAVVNLGGAVTVTALFLWFNVKREERADLLAKELMARWEKLDQSSREHNSTIARDYAASVGRMFETVTDLAEQALETAKETAVALNDLKVQVGHLSEEIRQLKPRR